MSAGRSRAARAAFIVGTSLAALMWMTGVAAAGPAPGFGLSPASLAFTAVVGQSDWQTVTVTTGRKDVAIEVAADHGFYSDTGAGTCATTYGMQVPANTSCTIQVAFSPLVAGSYPATLTVSQCLKWHAGGAGVTCDRVRASAGISLDGTALNIP